MLFRLVRPVKRKGSRNRYFVRRIPTDVMARAAGLKLAIPVGDNTQHVTISPRASTVRLSLRTDDPVEVKVRQAQVDAHLDLVWNAVRNDSPVPLSHRQATALAGELYRAWVDGEGRERTIAIEQAPGGGWQRVPGDHLEPEEWEAAVASLDRVANERDSVGLEKAFGFIIDGRLRARGIGRTAPETRGMILQAFYVALRDAFESRKRNAEGDYSPDPKSQRFPEWSPTASTARSGLTVSLKALVEAWWAEASATGRKPSTYDSYRRTVAVFGSYLGHDDASRITRENVVGFKDHRIASTNPRTGQRISPRTVKDSDLAALKSVFGWAVTNGKLTRNPAEGVTIKLGKRRKVRRGFEQAEADAILSAASRHSPAGERPETFAAKRWVPWLLAYTGARVGEMAQLRKEDVSQHGPHWVATISPEAGTVKGGEARRVVLHPHLVELGFVAFVHSTAPGHLFLKPSREGDVLGPLKGLKNRLREFARDIVSDVGVDPNHGWRHRFKSVCREVGIDAEVRDFMQGHAPRNVAERYGEMPLQALAAAVAKLPRYKVS